MGSPLAWWEHGFLPLLYSALRWEAWLATSALSSIVLGSTLHMAGYMSGLQSLVGYREAFVSLGLGWAGWALQSAGGGISSAPLGLEQLPQGSRLWATQPSLKKEVAIRCRQV